MFPPIGKPDGGICTIQRRRGRSRARVGVGSQAGCTGTSACRGAYPGAARLGLAGGLASGWEGGKHAPAHPAHPPRHAQVRFSARISEPCNARHVWRVELIHGSRIRLEMRSCACRDALRNAGHALRTLSLPTGARKRPSRLARSISESDISRRTTAWVRARSRGWPRNTATNRCSSPSTRTFRPAARASGRGAISSRASTATPTTCSSR
jgi:hypothetical protein